MKIIKRDGLEVDFDKSKIIKAVLAAFKDVEGDISAYAISKADNIAEYIEICTEEADHTLSVPEIQDLVERGLMSIKKKEIAKAYILYRNDRDRHRGNLTDDDMIEYLAGKNAYWNEENSNKDAKVVTTQRDYIAGIASTDIARRFILPKEVCAAHDEGIIHQHDMDYLAQNALTNCCLVNLDDMLQNGTIINGIKIEKPHTLRTASTIATQIITAVASSQYGGTTVTLSHLAPFVRMSYERYYNKYRKRGHNEEDSTLFATDDLTFEIRDAVQTFNYQINSMSTTNG